MTTSRHEGDLYVNGNLRSATLSIPAGTVNNADIAADADIAASKIEHQHIDTYSQDATTAVADETKAIHVVYGATGTLINFEAGVVTIATGAGAVTVDLQLGNSTGTASVLSAPITLDTGNTAYVVEAGTISATAVVDGDVLSVVVDETAGGGSVGAGLFATLTMRELAT